MPWIIAAVARPLVGLRLLGRVVVSEGKVAFSRSVILSALAISMTLCQVPTAASEGGSRRFSVQDDLKMVHFVDPSSEAPDAIKFSPDYQFFAVVTERGVLQQNIIQDSIWVFQTKDIQRRLQNPETPVRTNLHPIFQMIARHAPVIYDLDWLDSSNIVFRARSGGNAFQLITLNVNTRSVNPISSREQNVGMYGQLGVYHGNSIYTVVDPSIRGKTAAGQRRRVARVVSGSIADVLHLPSPDGSTSHEDNFDWRDLWVVKRGKRFKINTNAFQDPLHISPAVLPRQIGLSAHGRFAVIPLPIADVPERWKQYVVNPTQPFITRINSGHQNLDLQDTSFLTYQFMLIDVTTGTVKPLLDAPIGSSGGYHRPRPLAVWSPNGQKIALVNTYLPLDSEQGLRVPCIAVFNIQSRQVACVETVSEDTAAQKGERFSDITNVHFNNDSTKLTFSFEDSSNGTLGTLTFQRMRDGTWSRLSGLSTSAAPIQVALRQTLNDPPKLIATDQRTQRSLTILDPNVQIRSRDLGEASLFNWTDARGRLWSGALVKPPGYFSGRRYPLVIQTHGFNSGEFLASGAATTAFAARELAASGIVVLQVNDQMCTLHYMGSPEEIECATRGYESAVRQLVHDGIADPDKIGMTGFSQTGLYTMGMLTGKAVHLAAAVISDATVGGYLEFLEGIGDARGPGILRNDVGRIGVAPLGQGLQEWFARSPSFDMESVSTPVRFESVSETGTLYLWEPFALLQYLRKPTEMIQIDFGTHPLSNPAERLASQGGTLDWFRFWLKGEEDPDPVKSTQYRRWHILQTRTAAK